MATPVLKGIPGFIFTVFEPLSLLSGSYLALFTVDSFIADQIQGPTYSPRSFLPQSANAKMVAYQLGSLYGFSALLGFFILRQASDPQLVRNMLLCLAVADIGHISTCYYGMGAARFLDFGRWNTMAWGNIGVTAFLFVSRVAYLLGLFDGRSRTASKAKVR